MKRARSGSADSQEGRVQNETFSARHWAAPISTTRMNGNPSDATRVYYSICGPDGHDAGTAEQVTMCWVLDIYSATASKQPARRTAMIADRIPAWDCGCDPTRSVFNTNIDETHQLVHGHSIRKMQGNVLWIAMYAEKRPWELLLWLTLWQVVGADRLRGKSWGGKCLKKWLWAQAVNREKDVKNMLSELKAMNSDALLAHLTENIELFDCISGLDWGFGGVSRMDLLSLALACGGVRLTAVFTKMVADTSFKGLPDVVAWENTYAGAMGLGFSPSGSSGSCSSAQSSRGSSGASNAHSVWAASGSGRPASGSGSSSHRTVPASSSSFSPPSISFASSRPARVVWVEAKSHGDGALRAGQRVWLCVAADVGFETVALRIEKSNGAGPRAAGAAAAGRGPLVRAPSLAASAAAAPSSRGNTPPFPLGVSSIRQSSAAAPAAFSSSSSKAAAASSSAAAASSSAAATSSSMVAPAASASSSSRAAAAAASCAESEEVITCESEEVIDLT